MLSRVADSLYWMSRYLERAEHAARLIDVNLHLMLDQSLGSSSQRWGRLIESLNCSSEDVGDIDPADAYAAVRALAFDTENPNSIRSCIAAARENARHVREQISTEMFEQLNALYFQVRQTNLDDIWNFQPYEFFSSIRQGSHLFHGITDSTINHDQEWFFLQLGRYLERALCTATMLRTYARDERPSDESGFEAGAYLKWVGLLKSSVAYESYLRAYRGGVQPTHIAEFLLLDVTFPRSVRYSADRILGALRSIGEFTGSGRAASVERLAGRLQSQLQYAQIDELINRGLATFLDDIESQCDSISNQVYRVFIGYPIEELTV